MRRRTIEGRHCAPWGMLTRATTPNVVNFEIGRERFQPLAPFFLKPVRRIEIHGKTLNVSTAVTVDFFVLVWTELVDVVGTRFKRGP